MKLKYLIISALLAVTSLNAASDQRLVLDPGLAYETKRQILKDTEEYFSNSELTTAGDTVSLYDGSTGVLEASFTLPSLSYDVPRTRERAMRDFASAFRKWANETKDSNARLQIPEVLEEVARNANTETRIFFWGDPIYENSHVPEFNFIQDGVAGVPRRSALDLSQIEYPFGCRGRNSKNGASIFMITSYRESVDNRYVHQLKDFYGAFFEAQGTTELQNFGPANEEVIAQLFGAEIKETQKVETIDVAILEAEDPSAIRIQPLPPEERELSSLFICDSSGSNRSAMQQIASRLASQTKSRTLNYGLILFRHHGSSSDPTLKAYIHEITDEPLDMSEAFLKAPGGGMDTPGALYSALRIARDKLRAVRSKGTEIVIMADVAPVDRPNAAETETYAAMVDDLIADGHTLKFIKSRGPEQDTSWIQAGTFEVEEL